MTPLVRVALGFAAGTLVGLRVTLLPALIPAGLVACAIAAFVIWLGRRGRAGAVLALFTAVGWLSAASTAWRVRTDCRSQLKDGAQLTVLGALENSPGEAGSGWMRLESVRIDGRDHACRGVVRVSLPRGETPPAGVRVGAAGRWWSFAHDGHWPVPPERRGTLALRGVQAVGGGIAYPALHARGSAQQRLRELFPEQSGLAEALLLAQRGGIEADVRQRFAAAGLSHLLAISGTHVGLVAGTLLLLGGVLRLPGTWAAIAAAVATLGYVLFLGAPHAAARAALQILLLLAARLTQRPSDPYTLLACAGLLLLIADPLALLDAGFQLSFAGIFGLLSLRRPLMDRLPVSWPKWLRDGLASGTAATLATTPIAALQFGLVSGVGVLANLIAIPIVAACVPAVGLVLISGSVAPAVGHLLAPGAELLLMALGWTARVAAAVPFGHVYASRAGVLTWLCAAGTYVVARGWFSRAGHPFSGRAAGGRSQSRAGERPEGVERRALRVRRFAAAGVAAAVLGVLPALGRGPGDTLHIHAIDVGQGDAFAIRSPAGQWILVDAGPRSESFDAGRAKVVPFLLRHGVKRLEAVILTHPHADHIGGIRAILDAVDVRAIIDPGIPEASAMYAETLASARRAGTRWFAGREGREMRFGDVAIRFLAPLDEALDAPGDPNDYSLVFRLAYGRFGALFLGDAPMEVENRIVALYGSTLAAQVIKVGHHGSRTSTGDSLLSAARPRVALISAGRRNRYGHPNPDVLVRLGSHGVRIARTDQNGSVTVTVRATGDVMLSGSR